MATLYMMIFSVVYACYFYFLVLLGLNLWIMQTTSCKVCICLLYSNPKILLVYLSFRVEAHNFLALIQSLLAGLILSLFGELYFIIFFLLYTVRWNLRSSILRLAIHTRSACSPTNRKEKRNYHTWSCLIQIGNCVQFDCEKREKVPHKIPLLIHDVYLLFLDMWK